MSAESNVREWAQNKLIVPADVPRTMQQVYRDNMLAITRDTNISRCVPRKHADHYP